MRALSAVAPRRRGFSLFELLVILAVLAILVGLMLPAIQKVRDAAARTQSTNNLHQIGIATLNFHDTYNKLPPTFGKVGDKEGSIFYHLLPYLEHQNAYNAMVFDVPIREYVAPADPTNAPDKASTSYAANRALFDLPNVTLAQLSNWKGVSNTVTFAERYAARNGRWSLKDCAIDGTKGGVDFSGRPPGKEGNFADAFSGQVCMIALADGSVRAFSRGTRDTTFQWACDPKSQARPPADW